VSVLRVIATANVSAHATQPQMHPRVPRLEALLATTGPGLICLDLIEMAALPGHELLL
jgi:hypothetical protein